MTQGSKASAGWLICVAVALGLTAGPSRAETEVSEIRVSLHDGRLSVEAERAPLQAVLETVARRAGFTVEVRGKIAETVSPSIRALPLHAAIGALLEEGRHSFFLQFAEASPGESASRLARLVVIAANPNPALVERSGDEPAARRPAERPAAPVELDDTELQEAIEILEEMLQEEDLPLREAAAEALADLDEFTAAN